MIGNKIQSLYLIERNYPEAAALSFMMMAAILVTVLIYIRLAGTEAFMGADDEDGGVAGDVGVAQAQRPDHLRRASRSPTC